MLVTELLEVLPIENLQGSASDFISFGLTSLTSGQQCIGGGDPRFSVVLHVYIRQEIAGAFQKAMALEQLKNFKHFKSTRL